MRLLMPTLRALLSAVGLCAVAVVTLLIAAMLVQAQQQLDSVELLRKYLEKQPELPDDKARAEDRRRTLAQIVDRLNDVHAYRESLSMAGWLDTNPAYSFTGIVDREARTAIARKLEAALMGAAKGNRASREAVADFIGELGAGVRSLSVTDPFGYGRSLAPIVIELLPTEDSAVRQAAARALARINPEPKSAADALAKVLESKNVDDRRAAAKALADLINNVYQYQKKSRGGEAEISRKHVYEYATAALSAVGAALRDPDAVVRRGGLQAIVHAAVVLSELQPEPDPAMYPELAVRLKILEIADKESEPLVQMLRAHSQDVANLVSDPDVQVRKLARRSLESLASSHARWHRRRAGLPLAGGDDVAGKVVDPIGEALKPGFQAVVRQAVEPNLEVRRATLDFLEAVDYVGAMKDSPPDSSRALVTALSDPNRFIRLAAVRTLAKIGALKSDPKQQEKIIVGIAALLHPKEDSDVRQIAAAALPKYGSDAKIVLPTLIAMLNVGEAEAQEGVIKSIISIGGTQATQAIPALIKSLDANSAEVRRLAAEALGRMGPAAQSAVSSLQLHREDEDPTVRVAVNEAIINISRQPQ